MEGIRWTCNAAQEQGEVLETGEVIIVPLCKGKEVGMTLIAGGE